MMANRLAHVRLELCFVLRQRAFLYPDEATHLGTNRIHQLLALTTAYSRYDGSHVMVAAQLNDMRHIPPIWHLPMEPARPGVSGQH